VINTYPTFILSLLFIFSARMIGAAEGFFFDISKVICVHTCTHTAAQPRVCEINGVPGAEIISFIVGWWLVVTKGVCTHWLL